MSERYQQVLSDVNITYGAWFINDHGPYADIIRVDECQESNCGSAVIVEQGTIDMPSDAELKEVLKYADIENVDLTDKMCRYTVYVAVASYWGVEDEHPIVIQHETGEAARKVAYFVDGEEGLREWLDERYDIDWE